jgi:GNAT superfamily N-acetyltransferase
MDKLIIRKATKKDYKEVIMLYGLFVENKERYKHFDNDSYNKIIKNSNAILEVGIVNDKIIAFIMYSVRYVVRYPKPILEIEEFFVLDELRKLKIGSKLMDSAIEYAKAKNCQYIFLASAKERIVAHKFYKKYGFDEYAFHYRRAP